MTPPEYQRDKAAIEHAVAPETRYISPFIESRWPMAEAMWQRLVDWACPVDWVTAALLIPLLDDETLEPTGLRHALPGAYELAINYRAWKRRPLPIAPGRQQEAPLHIQRLQKLFLACYDGDTIPMLAIAEILARLDALAQYSPEAQQGIIRTTRVVLLPMLERYGLWELSHHATQRLFEHDTSARPAAIVNLVTTGEERRRRVLEEALRLQPLLPAGTTIALHPVRPARVLLNALNNEEAYGQEEAADRLQREATRLAIDITAPDQEACYLALGAVHQQWRPVGNYIKDHVGSPKFNGYQAIHILVNVNPTPDFSAEVEFFIASREMREINAWGRIAEFRRQQRAPGADDDRPARAWWHRAADSRRLLAQHPIGAYSSPTCVFSPLGEVYQLVQHATPVDYAFAVHSSVGHAYSGAVVNGRAVDTDFVLANGDIVNIQIGTATKTIDRAGWLAQVKSDLAAKQLRREYSRHIRHTQRGRDLIQKSLKTWCARYGLNFSDLREESYLIQVARRWSLGDLAAFYAAVASGRIEPEAVANHIVSLEMTHRVGHENGASLGLRPGRLQIAHCCRPALGDAIVGRFSQPATKHERVKVHKADCPMIRGVPVVPLTWRAVDYKGLYEYIATGDDREGILIDVLQPFYAHSAYLHRVRAERLRDESAQFELLVELRDPALAETIERAVRGVADIADCTKRPLTLSPREVFARRRKLENVNPFHYNLPARHKGEFVGRLAELTRVKQLLATPGAANHIVVSGPWKVGKTSLLQYLAEYDRVEFGAVAVMIDCNRIPQRSLETVLDEIMRAIGDRLAPEMDALGSYQLALGEDDYRYFHANPLEGFHRFLQRVRPMLNAGHGRRLVIMIDEFSNLYDDVRQGKLDGDIFRNLRGLFEREADVTFITVIQAAAIHHMTHQYRAELLESAELIRLGALDDDAVRGWLQRKLKQLELNCDQSILQRVMEEIGGNPYIANVLCNAVVKHVWETGATTVEAKHIDHGIEDMLSGHGDIYFGHLTVLLSDALERALLQELCRNGPGTWQSARDVLTGATLAPPAEPPDVERALDRLLSKGLLGSAAGNTLYKIQIPLFARWLRERGLSSHARGQHDVLQLYSP